jgi:hypothetical protein
MNIAHIEGGEERYLDMGVVPVTETNDGGVLAHVFELFLDIETLPAGS